jgi:hypothetical protein
LEEKLRDAQIEIQELQLKNEALEEQLLLEAQSVQCWVTP